jgi:hypothetical protein
MKYLVSLRKILVLLVFSSFSAYGQEYPFTLICSGYGSAGENNMLLNFNDFINGDGVLDGVSVVFVNMHGGGVNFYELIGWPKSQDTGNARDVKHKMEISIERNSGQYSVKVSLMGGSNKSVSANGTCEKRNIERKF